MSPLVYISLPVDQSPLSHGSGVSLVECVMKMWAIHKMKNIEFTTVAQKPEFELTALTQSHLSLHTCG